MKNNGWKSYLCLEIVEEMNRFALLNFKIFWGQPPILGRATAPLPTPHPPRHSGASRIRASLGAFGHSIVPLCVFFLEKF